MFSVRACAVGCLGLLGLSCAPARGADEVPAGGERFRVRPEFQFSRVELPRKPGEKAELPKDALEHLFAEDQRGVFRRIFGDRFEFGGHDVRALTPGPDGRLYFFCGDGGASIARREGGILRVPDEGAVLRCEPDGAHLEVYCRGLREVRGMAFDNVGNLFTSDAGSGKEDEGRWLNLVEHGDYGWRVGWLRSALGPARTPWIAEKLWAPCFDGQAAWILPAVLNMAAGAEGFIHYPGTGFTVRYDDHFFVCNPVRRTIVSWFVNASGTAFMLFDNVEIVGEAAAREGAFGPDSKLYFVTQEAADEDGKSTRVFSLSPADVRPDPQVEDVRHLLTDGLKEMTSGELQRLLRHPDQRVRLAAEWGLAVAVDSEDLLRDAALLKNGPLEPPFARLHAIWGLGIMARRADEKSPGAGAKILEPLVPLLEDNDLNVCAQAARVLGEQGVGAAFDGLIKALRNPEERVNMFAAEALAKLGRPEALPQLLLMVREADDHDPYRRHAYVDALLGMNDFSAIEQAARHDAPAVRRVALLAMRQLRRPEIVQFMHDEESSLVVEAARAINDENIAGAMPQLAALLETPTADEPLMLRVLNANFRLGQSANAAALATYAAREDAAEALRMDALQLLSSWAHPPPNDYVTGASQSLPKRDSAPAREALAAVLPRLQTVKSPGFAAAVVAATEALREGAK